MATHIIGLRDLRENTDKYIKAVDRGQSFTIVRRSRPVFKMVPVDQYGDEGVWKSLVNFRDKKGRGFPAEKLLALLEKKSHEKGR